MDFTLLEKCLNRHPEIIAAYVYGSALTGKLTPMSDVDVAVLFREEVSLAKELEINGDLMETIQRNFNREGDIRFLNRIRDLPFLHEVLSTGKLIFEADRDRHRAYVAQIVIAYLDFLPFYQKALQNYSASLKRGQPHLVLRKIAFIREHLQRVRMHQSASLADFLNDRDRQDIVCFNLYQAVQTCMDLANHLISDEGWGLPGSYGETAEILVRQKVLTSEQAVIFREMISFRNRLAHDYAEIDFTRVHEIMTKHLQDIDAYILSIAEYLHL